MPVHDQITGNFCLESFRELVFTAVPRSIEPAKLALYQQIKSIEGSTFPGTAVMLSLCERGVLPEVLIFSVSYQKSQDTFFGFLLEPFTFFGDLLEYFGAGKVPPLCSFDLNTGIFHCNSEESKGIHQNSEKSF